MKPQLPTVTIEFLEQIVCNVAKPKPTMPKKQPIAERVAEDILEGAEIAVKIDRRCEPKIKVAAHNIPIMSADLTRQVESVVTMYSQHKIWKEWGLSSLREGGAVILLEGPPGTGKTMIAEYLSKLVGRGMVKISMKEVGGKAPGDSERGVAEKFTQAKLQGNVTIFMDECDGILVARDRVGADAQYMIGVINECLQQIGTYRGLIVMATNRADKLDPALARRLLAKVHVGKPELPERLRLWQQKMPKQYPLKLTTVQYDKLAGYMLTGAEIENAILLESSHALLEKRLPTFATLQNCAASLVNE